MVEKFTESQKAQLHEQNISVEQACEQIERVKIGFAQIKITGAATLGNGITELHSPADLAEIYEEKMQHKSACKFVPASGAATRMFKELFELIAEPSSHIESLQRLKDCFYKLPQRHLLPFKPEADEDYVKAAKQWLSNNGFGLGSLPKALLDFHDYGKFIRKAIDEHFIEAAAYLPAGNAKCIQLTVSPEHEKGVEMHLTSQIKKLKADTRAEFDINFSNQKSSTNSLAIGDTGSPLFIADKLVFRPGGHGALLENLNDLEEDIIFIKNIDNVQPEEIGPTVSLWKKALAGQLLLVQEEINNYLNGPQDLDQGQALAEKYFQVDSNLSREEITELLNRPIRVCGMVKNEGEPGGGPFWVDYDWYRSLQIVEKSQIDLSIETNVQLLSKSTHFNPVDLVIGTKDYSGNNFNLMEYRDNESGMIVEKSIEGLPVKAIELPGLWNGAMAKWLTIFVEVPSVTFSPVKTIFDLAREEHQIKSFGI